MTWKDFIYPYEQAEEVSSAVLKERMKVKRGQELTASDYTQLEDAAVTNKEEWVAYRQALRDLPQQDPDPKNWVFPVRPV